MSKNIEKLIDEVQNLENINILYNELNIINSQQNLLSQKVSILVAINILIIGFIISFSLKYNHYGFYALTIEIIALFINSYILFPKYKIGGQYKKNLEVMPAYFATHNDFDDLKINIDKIIDEKNVIGQIRINSKILLKKYKYFKLALIFPIIFYIPYISFKKIIK